MNLAIELAYKNLMGAGLRTWLNVAVLSFAFIVIIFFNSLLQGWYNQAKEDSVAWEYGQGQLLNNNYDPYDPFTLQDGHGGIPENSKHLTPILIQQGSIYPEGRMVSVVLKGIDPDQSTIKIPTGVFKNSTAKIPAIIGNRMATSAQLNVGDEVLLRWRDKNGTFDAANITVVEIFDTNIASVDDGQIWIPIQGLWKMTGLQGHATMFVANERYDYQNTEGWHFQTQKTLLKDVEEIIATESVGSAVMYLVLLAIALLAIFDTQVLSIFRRQQEIGTYIALGMTRNQVIRIFTVEGTMYSILAVIVGAIYGTPIFTWLATTGIQMPASVLQMGMAIPKTMYPYFSFNIIIITILFVTIAAAIVSFLPARKIAKMNPVAALKGKLQ
jgi:ABC-type lipoprotein release transport system permease subunit